jgi:hypothetical protein
MMMRHQVLALDHSLVRDLMAVVQKDHFNPLVSLLVKDSKPHLRLWVIPLLLRLLRS